jgi:hypothetical protein
MNKKGIWERREGGREGGGERERERVQRHSNKPNYKKTISIFRSINTRNGCDERTYHNDTYN